MRHLLVLFTIVIAGCDSYGIEAAPPSGTLLQTDLPFYDADVVSNGPLFNRRRLVRVDIPYETRNTTSGSLYFIGCGRPPSAVLEKQQGDEWVVAYSPVELLCLSAPFDLEAGDLRRDTLRVRGFLPGQNAGPTFDTDLEGTYRLRRVIYTGTGSSGLGQEVVEDELTVSNTFELR